MKTIAVSANDLARNITMNVEIKVTGTALFRVRLWLGIRLIKLASLVIGCRISTTT